MDSSTAGLPLNFANAQLEGSVPFLASTFLRNAVFGLGTAQLVVSAAVLAGLAHLAGVGWSGAAMLGAGLEHVVLETDKFDTNIE